MSSTNIADLIAPLDPGPEVGFDATGQRVLTNALLTLVFQADETVGARFVQLTQKTTPGEYTFRNLPIPGLHPSDHRMWEARLTVRDATAAAVTPGPAVQVYQTADGLGYIFVWPCVTTSPEQRMIVAIRVTLAAGSPVSRWTGLLRWEPADPSVVRQGPTVESFTFPVCFFAPRPDDASIPSVPLEAMRVLIPNNAAALMPQQLAVNRSLRSYFRGMAGGVVEPQEHRLDHVHPGPQTMQFCAFYEPDATVTGGAGRMLYCGTEDAAGYYKVYHYRLIRAFDEATRPTVRFGWSHEYVPTYSDAFDDDRPAVTRNAFMTYPVVVGALLARDASFWYDAAAFYRDAFIAQHEADPDAAIGAPPITENASLSGPAKGPTLIGGFTYLLPPAAPPEQVFQGFLERMRSWQVALASPFVPAPSASYMQLQHYAPFTEPDFTILKNPDHPVPDHVEPAVIAMVPDAQAAGVRIVGYTRPGGVSLVQHWWELLRQGVPAQDVNALVHTRTGGVRIASEVPELLLDFKSEEAQTFYPQLLYPGLVQVGFTGAYLDVVSGGGSLLTYPNAPMGPIVAGPAVPPVSEMVAALARPARGRQAPRLPRPPQSPLAHGGDAYELGKIALIDNVRARLLSRVPRNEAPYVTVFSETTEEFLTGHLDIVGLSKDWTPRFLALAEDAVEAHLDAIGVSNPQYRLPDGGPWVPGRSAPAASDWSPPLWSAVYHEYAQASDPTVPLSNIALQAGVAPAELRALFACFNALYLSAGSKNATFPYFQDANFPLILLVDGEIVAPPDDRTGVGLKIVAFLRTLFACLEPDGAGPFLLHGRLERPLLGTTGTRTNPLQAVGTRLTWPAARVGTYPTILYLLDLVPISGSIRDLGFLVPEVVSSMWRERPGGDRALVLINWTAAAATWVGTLHPALYPGMAGAEYVVSETRYVTQGGTVLKEEVAAAGPFQGSLTIRAEQARPGPGQLVIGPRPAESVTLLRFHVV